MERHEGIIAIGVKLHGTDVKLVARKGYFGYDGLVFADVPTVEYLLKGFGHSTTISRFVASVSNILDRRYLDGNDELKQIMMDNVRAYTARTRREIGPYLH